MKRDNQDKTIKLACDFETTVYDGQTTTEVWSSAYVEIGDTSERVFIDHSKQPFRDPSGQDACTRRRRSPPPRR